MANTPIPSLPIATSLDGTEQLEIVQPPGSGGTSKRATSAQIAALASGQGAVAMAPFSVFGNPNQTAQIGTSIIGTAGQVLIVNDAGTAVLFGKVDINNPASVTGSITVAIGGTGTTGFVNHGVVIGNGTGGLSATAEGANGQIFCGFSNFPPTWQTMTGAATINTAGVLAIAANTVTFDKLQTMTGLSVFGVTGTARATGTSIIGTAGQALVVNDAGNALAFANLNFTSSIFTGTIPAYIGGTGLRTYSTGDLIYANTSAAFARLADVATGNVLLSGGPGVAPSWGKVDLSAAVTGSINILIGGTGTSGFTNHGVVLGNGTGGLSATAEGANGQIFLGFSNGAPTWQTMTGAATINTAGVLAIAANTVTFDKLQTMTGLSVFGVTGTARATGTSIIGTAGQALVVNDAGTLLGFGQVNLSNATAATGTLAVGLGGSGTTGFIANGVVIGNGTSGLKATAVGTNGQLFMGQAGTVPAFATMSGNATIDNGGVVTVPGAAKAWIYFDGSTGSTHASFNSTLAKNTVGDYTISFATGFASANYVAICNAAAIGDAAGLAIPGLTPTTTQFRFQTVQSNTNGFRDFTFIYCAFFGTQ